MAQESTQGVAQNWFTCDVLVLLGHLPTHAQPRTCGDNDNGCRHGWHRQDPGYARAIARMLYQSRMVLSKH